MFTNGLIVFNQMIIMSFLVGIGYLLYKKSIFDNHTTKSLSALLSKIVVPCCIIVSFQRSYNSKLAVTLIITFLCALILFVISIGIAMLFYRPSKYRNYADRQMSIIFTNNGFMALPLLKALFGDHGVFLGSAHIVCMSVVLWTYGVYILEGSEYKFSYKKILFNPGVLAAFFGVFLFISPIKLPGSVFSTVNFISQLNTPLAMFVLGCFLAQINLKQCFKSSTIWKTSLVRLMLIPAAAIVLLCFVPLDLTAKITLLVGVSAPTAIISPMFAQIYKTDYLFSTQVVALSTIISVASLPLFITSFDLISKFIIK